MTSFRLKLRLIFVSIFSLMTLFVILLVGRESLIITKRVSEEFATLYVDQIVNEMNTALQREIALSLKAAHNNSILNWSENELDPDFKRAAFEEMTQFNKLFLDHNIFLVIDQSKNFYFFEGNISYSAFTVQGILDKTLEADLWYFKSLASDEPYMLNVDIDRFLNTMRVWINTKMIHNDQIVGVIGTGLYLDPIIENIFETHQATGTKSIIINDYGAIQLDSRKQNIRLNSFEANDIIQQTIFEYNDASLVKDALVNYLNHSDQAMLIPIKNGQYDYLALAPIEDTSWHVATFFDSNSLFDLQNFVPMVLSILFVFIGLALLLSWIVHSISVKPLEQLTNSIHTHSFERDSQLYGVNRKDEFGILAQTIQNMKRQLDDYNKDLEGEIDKRTDALEKAYTQITLSEKRLHRLFNNMPVGIFIFNLNKNFIYGNPFFLNQFGYDNEAEFKANFESDVESFFTSKTQYENYLELLSNIASGTPIEIECLRKDGTPFWAQIIINEVVNDTLEWAYEGILMNIQDKKNYEEQLLEMATTDRLTALYNRHHFDQITRDEMAKTENSESGLTLVVFDLDHFKDVNDTWGHTVGDDVLKAVSKTASEIIRETDTLARWGGEEFSILMPNTKQEEAFKIAERLRTEIEALSYPTGIRITASFGIAERILSEDYISWFRRVDSALYKAKNNGRNQVVIFNWFNDSDESFVKLIWNNQFNSGIFEIDEEHKSLFDLANKLMSQKENTQQYADDILNFIDQHFNNEINLIAQLDYPNTQDHDNHHQALLKKAVNLIDQYKNGLVSRGALLVFIIDELILEHIMKDDMDFIKYFKHKN